MSDIKPKKLTNIRPREVSFVDNAANQKDFLVVKNMKKDTEIIKKLEVAIHTINFMKYQYPTIQDVKDFLIKQGVDPESGQILDHSDWEWRFLLNDESLFEGTSLASMSYIPMNKGVDSCVAVMKAMVSEINVEKKGAKVSSKNLEKIKNAHSSLESLIKELEDAEVSTEVKKDEQVKKDDSATQVAGEPAKAEETKEEPAKVEEQAKVEEPAKVQPDLEIEKRLKSLEDALKQKNEEIEVLKNKVDTLENIPSSSKGESTDKTVEVSKRAESLWSNIL